MDLGKGRSIYRFERAEMHESPSAPPPGGKFAAAAATRGRNGRARAANRCRSDR
jgi:hypothetical protein